MPSQCAIATSTKPVNATDESASSATAIAGSVGTPISVRLHLRQVEVAADLAHDEPADEHEEHERHRHAQALQPGCAGAGGLGVSVVVLMRARF